MAAVGDREDEERWLKHYSSNHQILLVGEGDFSFSLSLAYAFYSASNIVATSLDSQNTVVTKYAKAKSNLEALETMGATILHGVDATTMKLHSDMKMWKFDRIIYNFPHAGFKGKEVQIRLIKLHRQLVNDFFLNACYMLSPFGEVHVTHKTGSPYNKWKIEELASYNSLMLIECAAFNINDFPGYNNKRGDGVNCDQPFRLGKCCTYKFAIGGMNGKKASQKLKSAIGGMNGKKASQKLKSAIGGMNGKKASQKLKSAISHMKAVNAISEDGLWNATEISHSFDIRYRQADFMRKMAVRTQNTFVEPFDAEHIPSTDVKASSRWISGVPQTNFDTPVVEIQRELYSPQWYGISNLSSRALGNHVAELRDTVRKFGPDVRQLRLPEGFMPNVYEHVAELRDTVRKFGPDVRQLGLPEGFMPNVYEHVAELRDTVRKFGPDVRQLRLPEGFTPNVYEPRTEVRGGSDYIRDIIARYTPFWRF